MPLACCLSSPPAVSAAIAVVQRCSIATVVLVLRHNEHLMLGVLKKSSGTVLGTLPASCGFGPVLDPHFGEKIAVKT